MLGIIRVLTTNDKHVLYEHGNQMKESFHIETDTFCIPDQWSGIYDEESECISLPKIVTLAKEMEESNQFTAITISCAADPALQQVREEVSLPVIGAGSAGAYAASMVGDKVGIIGITEEAPVNMTELLKEKFYSYAHEPSIRKTVHLFSEDSQAKLLKLAERQIEQGADTILFACTGFSTIRLKKYLANYLNVPVIDLVEAQAIAYQLLKRGDQQ